MQELAALRDAHTIVTKERGTLVGELEELRQTAKENRLQHAAAIEAHEEASGKEKALSQQVRQCSRARLKINIIEKRTVTPQRFLLDVKIYQC